MSGPRSGAPPGKEHRPGVGTEAATETTGGGKSLDDKLTRPDEATRRHSSPFCRWRHFDMNRRRREHAEFKSLLARIEPAVKR
jgi:hypothetical protein